MADTPETEPFSDEIATAREAASDRLASAREKFSEIVDKKVRPRAREFGESAGRASDSLRDRAERASSGAREKVDSARDNVRLGYDRVTKDLEHLGEDVNEYVRHNPGKAVAIAVGVGFFLGILLRGRRD